jgi:hypothetical protein
MYEGNTPLGRGGGAFTLWGMKRPLLLIPCLASLGLTSCIVPGNPLDMIFPGAGVGYYDNGPNEYPADRYYYGGRYYSGGRYENGYYRYRGQPYNGRYYHNGRYYYGGRYETIGNPVRQQNRQTPYGRPYREAPSSRYY